MNKAIAKTCCVCSGNADIDIFNRIPVNMHAHPGEFRYWTKQIVELIWEITGIYVS